jgi:hypothetical protein
MSSSSIPSRANFSSACAAQEAQTRREQTALVRLAAERVVELGAGFEIRLRLQWAAGGIPEATANLLWNSLFSGASAGEALEYARGYIAVVDALDYQLSMLADGDGAWRAEGSDVTFDDAALQRRYDEASGNTGRAVKQLNLILERIKGIVRDST